MNRRHNATLALLTLAIFSLACSLLSFGGARLVVVPITDPGPDLLRELMPQARDVIARRLDKAGLKADVSVVGDGEKIQIEVDDEKDIPAATTLATQRGLLELFPLGADPRPVGSRVPDDFTPVLGSEDVAEAVVTLDQFGHSQVAVTFSPHGAEVLARFTETYPDSYLGIAVDRVLLIAPKVMEPITGGKAVITDPNFTPESALLLAAQISSGPLPLPLMLAPNP